MPCMTHEYRHVIHLNHTKMKSLEMSNFNRIHCMHFAQINQRSALSPWLLVYLQWAWPGWHRNTSERCDRFASSYSPLRCLQTDRQIKPNQQSLAEKYILVVTNWSGTMSGSEGGGGGKKHERNPLSPLLARYCCTYRMVMTRNPELNSTITRASEIPKSTSDSKWLLSKVWTCSPPRNADCQEVGNI